MNLRPDQQAELDKLDAARDAAWATFVRAEREGVPEDDLATLRKAFDKAREAYAAKMDELYGRRS